MKHFVVHAPDGRVIRFGYCADDTLELQAGAGETVIEAEFDQDQYVANGALVRMPPRPSPDHIFDYSQKLWVVDLALATSKAMARRNELLRNGPDRISPLWWNAMSPQEQQGWTAYRQSLLDIPDQSGFPLEIVWPAPPE